MLKLPHSHFRVASFAARRGNQRSRKKVCLAAVILPLMKSTTRKPEPRTPDSSERAAIRPLRRLGETSVADFMRTTWQRRPRVLRRVLAETHDLIAPQRVFALAREQAVQSRLVTAFDGRWRMRFGP